MADNDGDTKYCSNCKRDIATANFVMHEVHCRRNIVLCEHCNEPVPKSELDSHFEESHAPVSCNMCGQTLERAALDSHKEDDCVKRMKQCCFCELEVAFDALQDHQVVCGSRTERCTKCNQYVMLRDQGRHDDTNCIYPTPRSTNNHNNRRTTAGDEFFMPLDATRFFAYHDNGRIQAGEWGETWANDPIQNATGADLYQRGMNRSKRAPTNAERSHTNARGRGVNQTSTRTSRPVPNGELRHITRTRHANDFPQASDANEFLPLVPDANGQLRHNVPRASDANEFCPQLPVADGDVTEAPHTGITNNTPFMTTRHAQDLRSPNHFSVGSDLHSPTWPEEPADREEGEDLTNLPCEFCGEPYPADSLILHQGICSGKDTDAFSSPPAYIPSDVDTTWQRSDIPRNQPLFGGLDDFIPSIRSNNMLPSDDSAANHRSLLFDFEDNLSRLPDSGRLAHDRTRDVSHDLSPDMETPMLPCEFCDVLLPVDTLIQHQATCTAGGLDSPRPANERQPLQASDRRSQHPRRQPDPIISDIHARRKQETGYPRNNRMKNGPQQKKNNGSEEDSQVAPKWHNQRPPQNGSGDVSHVAHRWNNQRTPNSEQDAIPSGGHRRGLKSQGKCSLPPSVRDLMPKLAPAARNPVENRTSQGNVRNGTGGARRRQGGGGRSQGGGERSQGGGERSQGAGGRSQWGGERSQRGGGRSQGGGERSQGGGERSQGGAVAAEESLRHIVTEEAAVAVPMSPSVSPADDLEDVDATYVKSVDDDEAEAAGWLDRSRGHEDDGPSTVQLGSSRGRRTGGGPSNFQRPTKSANREGGAPSGGRGRNRNRRGGHAGSRRMPQGDV